MKNKDLYAILGLHDEAYWFEIKKAYRIKAKLNHPDRGGREEAFKNIEEAYRVLSDINSRIEYDIVNSYCDTNLRENIQESYLDIEHIVDGKPLIVKYYRNIFCNCGFDFWLFSFAFTNLS